MYQNRNFAWLQVSAMVALIAGCGGGAEQAQTPPNDTPAPTAVTATFAMGVVSNVLPLTFGDIQVDESNITKIAAEDDDDQRGAQLGVTLRVHAQGQAALSPMIRASEISMGAELRGTVTSSDNKGDGSTSSGRISVMGVPVMMTPQTVFDFGGDPIPIEGPRTGDVLQVHGFPQTSTENGRSTTRLIATRYRYRTQLNAAYKTVFALPQAAATGCVGCPIGGTRFTLPDLVIDVPASALQGVSLPINAGTLLRVRTNAPTNGKATALDVRRYAEPRLPAGESATMVMQAYAQSTGSNTLIVNGITASYEATTAFDRGSVEDLKRLRLLQVTGVYSQDRGTMVLTRVRFLD